MVPDAARRAEVLRVVDPRTAAENPERGFPALPHRAICWRALVIQMPVVLDPFPDIAVHVEKTPKIVLFGCNPMRCFIGIIFTPGIFAKPTGIVSK